MKRPALLIVVLAMLGAVVALADQDRGTCATSTVAITSGSLNRLTDGGWRVGVCGNVRSTDGGTVANDTACVSCAEIATLQELSQLDGGCYATLVQALCP